MRIKFLIIVILQVLLLTGMIAYRQHWVSTGEKILLKTIPVDPRDIFRGDYVRLSYEISGLDLDSLSLSESFKPNETIFVNLKKDEEGIYRASSVSRTQPAGETFIQGRILNEQQSSRWQVNFRDDSNNLHTLNPRWFFGYKNSERVMFCLDRQDNVLHQFKESSDYRPQCPSGNPLSGVIEEVIETKFKQLNIEYGIESYFVEEGKGREIETARNARDLKVEVSLRKDGKGIITGLVMDGKVIK